MQKVKVIKFCTVNIITGPVKLVFIDKLLR